MTAARGALRRVREMVVKELRQTFRDPRLARVLFVAPLLQLLIFGYAVSTDVRDTRLFVVDQDRTAAARELVAAFTASGYFRVVGRSARPADLLERLDHGTAMAGLVIPPGFARDLAAGAAIVQLLLDGTHSNTATIAKGHAERLVAGFARDHAAAAPAPALDLRLRAWYNPDLASRNYNVPAVIGALLLLICQLLTALAVVREREIGTLDQLRVSPLSASELILGKTIPFGLIGLVDLGLITALALAWFRVPFRGNPLVLLAGAVLFLLCGLGIGLLISSISTTQQEAFLSSFLVFMPTMLLSGFMFPVASMPPVFRWLTLANPLRHFLEVVRGVFLRGAGADALAPHLAALALLAVLLLGLAIHRLAREA
jgi:ABC-2 type transport system permease protein